MNLIAGRVYYIRVAGCVVSSFGPCFIYTAPIDLAEAVNDRCATALPSGVGTTVGNNTCAGFDGLTSCDAGLNAALWYSFTPTCSGAYLLDTCDDTDFMTTLTLYASCGSAELACNNIGCSNGAAAIAYAMVGGTAYLIRVAPLIPRVGSFRLRFSSLNGTSPANDSCSSPQVIRLGAITGSTNCATTTPHRAIFAFRSQLSRG